MHVEVKLTSFWEEGRWDKVKENISSGDYEECSSSKKKVPVVDMTALTKGFVEDLGVDATIQQIYLPTDGTHTQATMEQLVIQE